MTWAGSLNRDATSDATAADADNHQENYYLKLAILWAVLASAVAAASLNDLKIQLYTIKPYRSFDAYFRLTLG